MKRLVALLFVFSICLSIYFRPIEAKANSAQTDWRGSSQIGVVVTDGECPLVVEKEVLTFDLQDFPSHDGSNKNYSASVSAEYTFYNPSDLDLDVELAFPFGKRPSYSCEYIQPDDNGKYKVEINGEPISSKIRYTILSNNYFSKQDVQKIKSLRDSEVLIDKESMGYSYYFNVKKGTYKVFVQGSENNVIVANLPITRSEVDGITELYIEVAYDMTVEICVIGEEPEEVYLRYKNMYNPPKIQHDETKGVLVENFYQTICAMFQQERGGYTFREEDYFNAVVDVITLDANSFKTSEFYLGDRTFSWRILAWYEYEMHVGAGERIVNKVTAQIFPYIDSYWTPSKYEYKYLLSPAKSWKSFGELEIIINTSSKMLKSEGFNFEKTDSGYKLKLDGLPDRELVFTLCATEKPEGKKSRGCVLSLYGDSVALVGVILSLCAIRIIRKKQKVSQ